MFFQDFFSFYLSLGEFMWIKACTGILKTSSRESSFISFNFKLQIKLQYNAHRNFETTFPVDLDEAGR